MASIIQSGVQTQTSIVVQTRRGTSIDNDQAWKVTRQMRLMAAEFDREYPPPPEAKDYMRVISPVYNCHGLTFASRRTGIADSGDVQTILQDDDYKKVDCQEVQPGDVILYFKEGDIEHSGIVLGKLHGWALVLSKWGRLQERVHWWHRCPYDCSAVEYRRVMR